MLASRLDAIDGVTVTLESALVARLLERGFETLTRDQIRPLADFLLAERKLRDWPVSRAALEAGLEARAPCGLEGLLRSVLEIRYPAADTRYWIVKGVRTTPHLEQIRKAITGVGFINLVRDPRAVYCSQRGAKDSNHGLSLCDEPVGFARQWSVEVERVTLSAGADSMLVRYEDLLSELDGTVAHICRFLTDDDRPLEASRVQCDGRYAASIPAAQRHLHTNVAAAIDRSRASAWRRQIGVCERALVERIAGEQMRAIGYLQPLDAAPRVAGAQMLAERVVSAAKRTLRRARLLAYYARSWESLTGRLREKRCRAQL